jgi:hypothetical protein
MIHAAAAAVRIFQDNPTGFHVALHAVDSDHMTPWGTRLMFSVQSMLADLASRTGLATVPPFKVWAAAGSLLCNAVFFWLLFRQDIEPGDARLLAADSLPVMISAPSAQTPSQSKVPPTPPVALEDPSPLEIESPPEPLLQKLADSDADAPQDIETPAEEAQATPATPPEAPAVLASDAASPSPRTITIAPAQQATLTQRMVEAAQALAGAERAEVSWSENGQTYSATLVRSANTDSMALEHVIADVRTTNADGTQLKTQLKVQRLAFSQFSQVIDYWDARVQLHDDEIVGRFHSNSPFAIAADGEATPKFLGKVTTAGRALTYVTGGLQRRDKMFPGGLQMRAGRIEFPQQSRPFAVTPPQDSYVHSLVEDTHLVFFADGTYTSQGRRAKTPELLRYPQDRPAYFIAPKGITAYVRGTVDGKVLVYSAQGIVIEGDLIYASNPRTTPDVDDYLGLVSDRNVEIAPPHVTGRGDLNIHAAIFARGRFVVTSIDVARSGTLFLYGSLTIGSISASEPRYATKIEFDPRLDRARPPSFPNTNRYEIASWQGTWSEQPR